MERQSFQRLTVAALALAWLLLLHPFHAPAVVMAVLLYALVRQAGRRADGSSTWRRIGMSLAWMAAWLLLTVSLVAWWLMPLLTHYTPYAAALMRANPHQVQTWFTAASTEWLCLAAPFALLLLPSQHPRVDAAVAALALLVPLLVGGIFFDMAVLVARFDMTLFDPIRFMAQYYLALILLAGAAVAAVTSRLLWRFEVENSPRDAHLLIKMSHYPLWRAQIQGQSIPIAATPDGLQAIELPAGGPYTLELAYREGGVEWAALVLSLAALLLLGAMAAHSALRLARVPRRLALPAHAAACDG